MTGTTLTAVLVSTALGGALASIWLARGWRRVRMRRRFRRAREGEIEAERLLRGHGYRILDEQVTREAHLFVDGVRVNYRVRADLLVSKRWKTYVAEVKTGKSAPDPKHTPTRRQLLEYATVYAADGLLLVDMHAQQVLEVRFPSTADGASERLRWLSALVLSLFLGVLLGLAWGLDLSI